MRQIIMVNDLSKHDTTDMEQALHHAHIVFEIHKERGIVIVEGNNDKLRFAKQLLQDLGYEVL